MATPREYLESVIQVAGNLQFKTDEELKDYEKDLRKVDTLLDDILFSIDLPEE